jgi:hypothetical protein
MYAKKWTNLCTVVLNAVVFQYTRFRKGNCTFILSSTAKNCPVEWKHSFNFNTYPGLHDTGITDLYVGCVCVFCSWRETQLHWNRPGKLSIYGPDQRPWNIISFLIGSWPRSLLTCWLCNKVQREKEFLPKQHREVWAGCRVQHKGGGWSIHCSGKTKMSNDWCVYLRWS